MHYMALNGARFHVSATISYSVSVVFTVLCYVFVFPAVHSVGAWLDRLSLPEYRKTSNISRTLVGNKIVDNSDVVGASPVGAAPTTSSFST